MSHPTFEFDQGLCHVMEDKIVFNQSSNPEERYGLGSANPVSELFHKLASIGFILFYCFYVTFDENDILGLMTPLLILAFVIIQWFISYGVSKTQLIPIENLLYVDYKAYKFGRAYGYFVFHFKDGNGHKRKRYLIMKPFDTGSGETIAHAKSLLTTRGLLQT